MNEHLNQYGLYPASYCRSTGLPMYSKATYEPMADRYISATRCKKLGRPSRTRRGAGRLLPLPEWILPAVLQGAEQIKKPPCVMLLTTRMGENRKRRQSAYT